MIERHVTPEPDACEVCLHVVTHPDEDLDLRLEHTLAWICQAMLVQDLAQAQRPFPLQSLAVSGIGEPGPVTRLEPRHWFWGMMTDRNVLISLREGVTLDVH